jgi:hypothetical protein
MAFTPQSNLADANIDQIPPSADAVSGTPFLVKVPGPYFTPVCGGLVVAVLDKADTKPCE